MFKLLWVAASLLLLPAGSALAQPEAVATDMLIIGGGKIRADAERAKAAFVKKVWLLARQKPDSAWPQIMKSDEVAGLKPGLHIAVAGVCTHERNDPSTRAAATKAVKAVEGGSYAKTVTASIGDLCPTPEMLGAGDAEERRLRAAIDQAPSGKSLLAYGLYLKEHARLWESSLVIDEALTLDPENVEAKQLAALLTVLMSD